MENVILGKQGVEAPASRYKGAWHWLSQTAPPLLVFWIAFGTFNPGTAILVGPATFYSLLRLVYLAIRKQWLFILRPALMLLLGGIVVGMGNYYKMRSIEFVKQAARELHAQCNLDGECKVPNADWKDLYGDGRTFFTRSPGLVQFPVQLSFNPKLPPHSCDAEPQTSCPKKSEPNLVIEQKRVSFTIIRYVTDFSYGVTGGVGKPLSFSEGSG